MFVALSEKNEKVEKYLGKFLAFGPAARIKYEHSVIFNSLINLKIDVLLEMLGIQEILSYGFLINHPVIETGCAFFGKLCRFFLGPICETDPTVDNY